MLVYCLFLASHNVFTAVIHPVKGYFDAVLPKVTFDSWHTCRQFFNRRQINGHYVDLWAFILMIFKVRVFSAAEVTDVFACSH